MKYSWQIQKSQWAKQVGNLLVSQPLLVWIWKSVKDCKTCCNWLFVFVWSSVCLIISLLGLIVSRRLQSLFVSVFVYLFLFVCMFPCIYVCVRVFQPLLVWIWESVEDCKTLLCLCLCLCLCFLVFFMFMSVFPCIYVCVCLSQPPLVWIWESVEDCKTFLCLRLFICFIIICVFVFVSIFVSVCLSHFSSGSESPLKIAKPQRGSFPPNKGCNGCCPQE